eukprot:TRINITY_DN1994_c0_g1_i1.p1 TRINITY_DN1994_c0_g1~~TRINITY_DN1994_c0_g1_i1.p1  ORF type:complete len:523 (+),score=122.33 TRINITY_DN1994_c0_g1_i1:69-1571(+)
MRNGSFADSDESTPSQERNIVGKRWEVLKHKLGEGNYGKVYQGKDLQTGAPIAVKVTNMKNLSKDLQERLKGETEILTQVRHPNIVTLYDQLQNEKYQLLMLEFMQGKDMHKFMVRGQPMKPHLTRRLFGDLSNGLLELHKRKIIHRDLKPQNLLLSSTDPETAILKIADFGFARYLGPREDMAKTIAGSPLYMAPEVLEAAVGNAPKGYNSKADLYSAGVILYQMVQGEPPYSAMTPHELLQKLKANKRKPVVTSEPNLRELLDRLLQPDPSRRMGMEEFFVDPWVMQCLSSRPWRAAAQSAATAAIVAAVASCKLGDFGRKKETAIWSSIQEKLTGAELIVKVTNRMSPSMPNMMSLYMRALDLVGSAWGSLHGERQLLLSMLNEKDWVTARSQLNELFTACSAVLAECFDKITPPDEDAEIEPADDLLFTHAKDLCLRASVEEVINNKETAYALYALALEVMQHISSEVTSGTHSVQRLTASKCIDMISKRIRKTAL